VMMEPEGADPARFANYSNRTREQNMESVMFVLTEMLTEAQFSSLEWTPPGKAGVCSQCGNPDRILHPDVGAESCFECKQYVPVKATTKRTRDAEPSDNETEPSDNETEPSDNETEPETIELTPKEASCDEYKSTEDKKKKKESNAK
jgi:hypothetical protein